MTEYFVEKIFKGIILKILLPIIRPLMKVSVNMIITKDWPYSFILLIFSGNAIINKYPEKMLLTVCNNVKYHH